MAKRRKKEVAVEVSASEEYLVQVDSENDLTSVEAPVLSKSWTLSDVLERKEAAIKAVNESFKYRMAVPDDEDPIAKPRWVISTGLPQLDDALGGGMFEGRWMKYYGPFGCGKTTLLYHLLLQMMKYKGICICVDPENSMDQDRMKHMAKIQNIEWIPELIVPVEPNHIEDLFEALYFNLQDFHPVPESYTKRPEFKEPLGIFVDTLTACPTKDEYEKTKKKKKKKGAGMQARARRVHEHMRKIGKLLGLHGATLVGVEQSIEKIGAYVPSITTSGGHGTSFKSSQLFQVRPSTAIVRDERAVGRWIRIRTEKIRHTSPQSTVMIPLYYATGFNPLEGLCNLLVDAGKLRKYGGKYTFLLPDGSKSDLAFTEDELLKHQLSEEATQKILSDYGMIKDVLWKATASTSSSPDD